jgi:hypothetical protein
MFSQPADPWRQLSIISAGITDAESGINSASISVYVDDQWLHNCNYGDWQNPNSIGCYAYSLGIGTHQITGSVADNAGNVPHIRQLH